MIRVKRMQLIAAFAVLFMIVSGQAFAECGTASYYTMGHTTANGESYNHRGISAAHKTLPFGTRVRVTHRGTGRSITVRINDRGPFIPGRIIDLSSGAKAALGMGGLAPVCLDVVSYGNGGRVRYASRKSRGARIASHRRSKSVRVASSRRGKAVRAASRKARYAKVSRKQRQYGRLRGTRYAQASRSKRMRISTE